MRENAYLYAFFMTLNLGQPYPEQPMGVERLVAIRTMLSARKRHNARGTQSFFRTLKKGSVLFFIC